MPLSGTDVDVESSKLDAVTDKGVSLSATMAANLASLSAIGDTTESTAALVGSLKVSVARVSTPKDADKDVRGTAKKSSALRKKSNRFMKVVVCCKMFLSF